MKCSRCKKRDAASGKKNCQICIKYNREYYKHNKEAISEQQKGYYKKNKEAIIERTNDRRARLAGAGLCIFCGKNKSARAGLCAICWLIDRDNSRKYRIKNAEKLRFKDMNRRKKLIANGLCPQCGKPNDNGTYYCYVCHERILQLIAERRG